MLFELLLQTENTDVPTSVTGDLEAGALGFLMMTLKRQYSALQRLEELKNRTYVKKKKKKEVLRNNYYERLGNSSTG